MSSEFIKNPSSVARTGGKIVDGRGCAPHWVSIRLTTKELHHLKSISESEIVAIKLLINQSMDRENSSDR